MKNDKTMEVIQIISKVIRTDINLIDNSSGISDFAKWDSLAHLQIMQQIEKKFKKKISTSKMGELNSVKKIIKFLET